MERNESTEVLLELTSLVWIVSLIDLTRKSLISGSGYTPIAVQVMLNPSEATSFSWSTSTAAISNDLTGSGEGERERDKRQMEASRRRCSMSGHLPYITR